MKINIKDLRENNLYLNDEEYMECVKDLIDNEVVLKMKDYIQHGSTNCYDHCICVSYFSFKLGKKLKLDARSMARAGLIHDLFLYDWHKQPKDIPLFKKHGFVHPKIALDNAVKYFNLNLIERDIIVNHMWPLTFKKFPRYRETYFVSLVDKRASTYETFEPLFEKVKNVVSIKEI